MALKGLPALASVDGDAEAEEEDEEEEEEEEDDDDAEGGAAEAVEVAAAAVNGLPVPAPDVSAPATVLPTFPPPLEKRRTACARCMACSAEISDDADDVKGWCPPGSCRLDRRRRRAADGGWSFSTEDRWSTGEDMRRARCPLTRRIGVKNSMSIRGLPSQPHRMTPRQASDGNKK